jgi:hypothetical protein
MKSKLLLLIVLIFPFTLKAQSLRHDLYAPNIVRMDQETDFGLIIGTSPGHIYFVTAGRLDIAEENRTALLYQEKDFQQAKFMRSFTFGKGRVLLYDIPTSSKTKWQANFYGSRRNFTGPFQSFIPETRQTQKLINSRWFANNAALDVNASSKGLTDLRVTKGNAVFRGMPVVDGYNSIAGIIIDTQSEFSPAPVVSVISMADIADRFYSWNGCKYFQMIEFGQPGTRCEIDQKASASSRDLENRARRDNQIQSIAFGPAFSAALPAMSTNGDSHTAGGSVYALGFNLETSPDKDNFHITFKPRVNFVKFNIKDNLTPNSSIGFNANRYSWQSFEVPVMFEFLFSRSIGGNTYWGIGYVPGLQSDINYRFYT